MNHRERTLEQLDPLTAVNGQPVSVLGSTSIVIYAIVMTALNREDVDVWWLAVAALVLLAGAAVVIVVATSPLRPPATRRLFLIAVALGLGAMALNAASMHASNAYIQDDWGTITLGVILLLFCPYRPPRELLIVVILAAIFAGFIVLVQTPTLATDLPTAAFIVIAVTPLLAMGLSGVGFAEIVLKMLRRWQRRANRAVQSLADEQRVGITRSVQQDRITILNRDVVPFFTEVLERGELTDADRERAADIASSIRQLVVAEVDRTWLDMLVEQVSARRIPPKAVFDPERIAGWMATDQRTALRALLQAVIEHPGFDPLAFSIVIDRDGALARGVLHASFTPPLTRAGFAAFLAVARVVFVDLQVDQAASALTVRFFYAQR